MMSTPNASWRPTTVSGVQEMAGAVDVRAEGGGVVGDLLRDWARL